MVFKSLKSNNHIPFSQAAVEELLPCSSDENWDREIQLKGSIAGCLLWEAYYLDFFQHTKLYTALYMFSSTAPIDFPDRPGCSTYLQIKVLPQSDPERKDTQIVTTWRTFGSKDLVALIRNSGKGRNTFNSFKHLNNDLIFSLLSVPARFVVHLPISAIKSTEVLWTSSLLHHLYPLRKMRHNCFGENSM